MKNEHEVQMPKSLHEVYELPKHIVENHKQEQQININVEVAKRLIIEYKAVALADYKSDVEGERTGAELLLQVIKEYYKQHGLNELYEQLPQIVKECNDHVSRDLPELPPKLQRWCEFQENMLGICNHEQFKEHKKLKQQIKSWHNRNLLILSSLLAFDVLVVVLWMVTK